MAAVSGTHLHFQFFLQPNEGKSTPVLGYSKCSLEPCNCSASIPQTEAFAVLPLENHQLTLIEAPEKYNWNLSRIDRLFTFLNESIGGLVEAISQTTHPVELSSFYKLKDGIPPLTWNEEVSLTTKKVKLKARIYTLISAAIDRNYPKISSSLKRTSYKAKKQTKSIPTKPHKIKKRVTFAPELDRLQMRAQKGLPLGEMSPQLAHEVKEQLMKKKEIKRLRS